MGLPAIVISDVVAVIGAITHRAMTGQNAEQQCVFRLSTQESW